MLFRSLMVYCIEGLLCSSQDSIDRGLTICLMFYDILYRGSTILFFDLMVYYIEG